MLARHSRLLSFVLVLTVLLGVAGVVPVTAQDPGPGGGQAPQGASSGFTYQGRLNNGGADVDGLCDFAFGLYASSGGAVPVAVTQTVNSLAVNDGYFTTVLNFGDVFAGSNRFLNIAVRCPAGSGSFVTLSPRQELLATPYALFALAASWDGLTNLPAGFADGVDNVADNDAVWLLGGNTGTTAGDTLGTSDNVSLTLVVNDDPALRLVPHVTAVSVLGGESTNTLSSGAYGGFIGGGATNVISPGVPYGVIAGGLSNRSGSTQAVVGGGQGNQADGSQSVIGGGSGNRTFGEWSAVGGGVGNQAISTYATIGGGFGNLADDAGTTVAGGRANIASAPGATVGGGGYLGGGTTDGNEAYGDASTIGGGYGNIITPTDGADFAVIGGGGANEARGGYSVIGGGFNNFIGSGFTYATIGGGNGNDALGLYATVSGGDHNTAGGSYSTVAGGRSNTANGDHAFAAGYGAHANHSGSWVWACGSCALTYSPASNTYAANASGGFWFGNVSGGSITPTIGAGNFISTSTGARLTTGGAWADASDRNVKTNFAPVDGVAVLEALLALPIETWSYRAEADGIRHLGPTAQDFYAAFGLGDSDVSITTVDRDGVALAAIQGLYTVVQAKDAALAEQQAELAALTERVAALEQGAAPTAPVNGTLQLALVLIVGLLAGAVLGAGAFALGKSQRGTKKD